MPFSEDIHGDEDGRAIANYCCVEADYYFIRIGTGDYECVQVNLYVAEKLGDVLKRAVEYARSQDAAK